MKTEQDTTKEIEKRLDGIHEILVTARDASHEGLQRLAALSSQQERHP